MIAYAPSNWPGMNTGIPAVCGPMGSSARDLTLFYRLVRDTKPWLYDPSLVPEKSEADVSDRRPVVGVFTQSGGCKPHPPVIRAINEAAEKLKAAGYEVREFVPPDFTEIRDLSHELLSLDGLSYAKREMEKAGEPPVVSVLNSGFWDKERKTFEEAWAYNARKIALQKLMLDAWQAAKVDVVLGPAGPHTAVKPNEWTNFMYTVAWNVVDVSPLFSSLVEIRIVWLISPAVSRRYCSLHHSRPRERPQGCVFQPSIHTRCRERGYV
jgi:amidase